MSLWKLTVLQTPMEDWKNWAFVPIFVRAGLTLYLFASHHGQHPPTAKGLKKGTVLYHGEWQEKRYSLGQGLVTDFVFYPIGGYMEKIQVSYETQASVNR